MKPCPEGCTPAAPDGLHRMLRWGRPAAPDLDAALYLVDSWRGSLIIAKSGRQQFSAGEDEWPIFCSMPLFQQ